MAQVPTVRIVSGHGSVVINESDFDLDRHTLFVEGAEGAEDEPMSRDDLKAFFDQEDIEYRGNASTVALQALYDEHVG